MVAGHRGAAAGLPGGAPVPGAHAHGGGTRRDVITLGVEEEYLLLDPDTAVPLPLAEEVRAAAGLQTIARAGEIQPELLLAQVEVATPVCGELAELGRHLLRLRHAIAAAAATAGCRAIASGAAPLTGPGHPPVTDKPRYRELSARGRVWSTNSSSTACTCTPPCPTGRREWPC
ncbi:glutamate-cysteine ligase family protein [Streptomyces stramineus]